MLTSLNPFVKSPTSRVLAIPELLDIIFSHLDPPSIASNACVSKAWSEVALNVLWCEVDDLKRLIGLLVPLNNRNGVFWASLPYVIEGRRLNIILSVGTHALTPTFRLASFLEIRKARSSFILQHTPLVPLPTENPLQCIFRTWPNSLKFPDFTLFEVT